MWESLSCVCGDELVVWRKCIIYKYNIILGKGLGTLESAPKETKRLPSRSWWQDAYSLHFEDDGADLREGQHSLLWATQCLGSRVRPQTQEAERKVHGLPHLAFSYIESGELGR